MYVHIWIILCEFVSGFDFLDEDISGITADLAVVSKFAYSFPIMVGLNLSATLFVQ